MKGFFLQRKRDKEMGGKESILRDDSNFSEKVIRIQFPAENNSRNRIVQKLLKDFSLSFFIQSIHVGILHKSYDLQTCCLKMFKISRHLQGRSVDIRLCKLDLGDVNLRCQIFPFKLVNYLR